MKRSLVTSYGEYAQVGAMRHVVSKINGLYRHLTNANFSCLLSQVVIKYSSCSTVNANLHNNSSHSGDTVHNVVQHWQSLFEASGVPEGRESIGFIVAHVLGHSMIHEVDPCTVLSSQQIPTVDAMCKKRLDRMPVQYIIGEWDFRDLTLLMRPPVFIPRPETEELVEHVQQDLITSGITSPRILEIGCGSGAICLSLLKLFPQASAVAVDQSENAVQLTSDNAVKHDVHDRLVVRQLNLNKECFGAECFQEKYDVLVSNPPYIPDGDMCDLSEEVIRYEDSKALFGGHDGLNVIRDIINLAEQVLHPNRSLWLEVDSSQPPLIDSYIASLDEKNNRLHYKKTYTDFNGRSRFCQISVESDHCD